MVAYSSGVKRKAINSDCFSLMGLGVRQIVFAGVFSWCC
jgi:hypothetical protein